MCSIKYPVGMQSFPKIILGGYTYVDKTRYIKPLLEHGQFIFLSRPRRFGKSLLLSTLMSYFEGRRELFKGLDADSMHLDWTPHPVLRFDLNAEDFTQEDGLTSLLNRLLEEYEQQYDVNEITDTLAGRFSRLIRRAHEVTGRKVVILVDEYDKPLQDIYENEQLFEKNLRTLKAFFGNLKSMDDYIRFAFITGVARFAKVSIFSDLNNLKDISMTNEYADICGWTEAELLKYFREGIVQLAETREEVFETTLTEMRKYYDGYLFAPLGSRLYNPYSVLNALTDKDIYEYWFDTGTPSFLARWVRENGMSPWDNDEILASRKDLTTVELECLNPVTLLYHAGYLTIESYDRECQLYTLKIPNEEAKGAYRKLFHNEEKEKKDHRGLEYEIEEA